MEDLLILGGFASLILFIFCYAIVATVKSCNTKKKARDEMNAEIMRKGREVQEARSKKLDEDLVKAKQYYSPSKIVNTVPPKKTYTYTEPASASKQDDGFMDSVMTAALLNHVMNSNNDVHRGTIFKSDDVTIKSDDSPSYRDSSPSSSWSSSSSDSSSSYSSSSSSSDSYSSPSSDW